MCHSGFLVFIFIVKNYSYFFLFVHYAIRLFKLVVTNDPLLVQAAHALDVVALVQILVSKHVNYCNTADVWQLTLIRSLDSLFSFLSFMYLLFPISTLQYFHVLIVLFI